MRRAALVLMATTLAACGSSLPRPRAIPQPPSAFTEVAYPPPPARVEYVPKRPNDRAVWVDGAWAWEGNRWRWHEGGWFAVPPEIYYSTWAAARPGDGRLLFANAAWRDKSGTEVPAPQPLAAATSGATDVSAPSQAPSQGSAAPPTPEGASGGKSP